MSADWSRVEGCPPRRRRGHTGGLASWTQPECERAAANHLGTKAHLGLRACEPLAAGSQLHTHKHKPGSAVRVWAKVPSAEACRAVFVEPESRRGRRGGKERRAPCARSGAAHALSEPGFWQDQVAEIMAVLMERWRRGKSYPGHGAGGLREGHRATLGGMQRTLPERQRFGVLTRHGAIYADRFYRESKPVLANTHSRIYKTRLMHFKTNKLRMTI